MTDNCSPGEHPHADQPNYGLADYIDMCRSGEVQFSVGEAATTMGVSRSHVYRMMSLSDVPDEVFEDILATNKTLSLTAIADEVKRRTGRAREYVESCPHCGGALRTRHR